MIKSFCLYHELDIPEELKNMVLKVEEKFDVKEEGTIETPLAKEFVSNTEENINNIPKTKEISLDIENAIEIKEASFDVECVTDTVENTDTEVQSSDEAIGF